MKSDTSFLITSREIHAMPPHTIIATNTPLAFSLHDDVSFLHLGDGIDDASMIILMLEKNWGGNFIDEINAMTHWVSAYPTGVPCYLIGSESRIPESNVQKYTMPERDSAIRALCDEVLRRSTSIGVRGDITRLHLTQLLGYDERQVDVIYDSETSNDTSKLRSFLSKNKFPLRHYDWDFLIFQRRPIAGYQRPISFEREIRISRPYIEVGDRTAKLCADVRIDGKVQTLWCETQKAYYHYLLVERADAFVCALLPLAMRSGKNIASEAPVTAQFLHNLSEILIPQLFAHDSRLYYTQLQASADSSILISGNAVATGMSCGVDSFYTVGLYLSSPLHSMNLTHLYTGNYIYGNDGPVYERAERAAGDLGLPLVRTGTNINEELKLPHLYTHFFKTMFGVLALRKLFRIYYYSTAEDFSHFKLSANGTGDTALVELLLLYTFTCSDFQIVTGGVKSERTEKTRAICALPTARKLLNVCLHPEKATNCGRCEKCVRTLLALDMLDSLDLFREAFDIDDYRINRLKKFVYLVEQKKSIMLADVYSYFCTTEPLLIEQAEALFAAEFSGELRRAKMLAFI